MDKLSFPSKARRDASGTMRGGGETGAPEVSVILKRRCYSHKISTMVCSRKKGLSIGEKPHKYSGVTCSDCRCPVSARVLHGQPSCPASRGHGIGSVPCASSALVRPWIKTGHKQEVRRTSSYQRGRRTQPGDLFGPADNHRSPSAALEGFSIALRDSPLHCAAEMDGWSNSVELGPRGFSEAWRKAGFLFSRAPVPRATMKKMQSAFTSRF